MTNSHGNTNSSLDYHHDGGAAKGQVKALYAPSLTQCGCYQITDSRVASRWQGGANVRLVPAPFSPGGNSRCIRQEAQTPHRPVRQRRPLEFSRMLRPRGRRTGDNSVE